jgi:hypothetical protein
MLSLCVQHLGYVFRSLLVELGVHLQAKVKLMTKTFRTVFHLLLEQLGQEPSTVLNPNPVPCVSDAIEWSITAPVFPSGGGFNISSISVRISYPLLTMTERGLRREGRAKLQE